jgi:hypothetical protein
MIVLACTYFDVVDLQDRFLSELTPQHSEPRKGRDGPDQQMS